MNDKLAKKNFHTFPNANRIVTFSSVFAYQLNALPREGWTLAVFHSFFFAMKSNLKLLPLWHVFRFTFGSCSLVRFFYIIFYRSCSFFFMLFYKFPFFRCHLFLICFSPFSAINVQSFDEHSTFENWLRCDCIFWLLSERNEKKKSSLSTYLFDNIRRRKTFQWMKKKHFSGKQI